MVWEKSQSNFEEHATGISEKKYLWLAEPAWKGTLELIPIEHSYRALGL